MFFPDEPWSFLFLSICVFAAPIGIVISLVWSFRLTEQKRERLLISSIFIIGILTVALAIMGDFWNWDIAFKGSVITMSIGLFLLLLWFVRYPKLKQNIMLPLLIGAGISLASISLAIIFD